MQLLGFPPFSTVEELAALIRIDARQLSVLAMRPERFYRKYRIRKRRGGWRQVHSPSKELKAVQAWVLRRILDKLSTSPYTTAYVKGRRLLDNVTPHISNRYFLSVDVRNFFPSVRSFEVRRLFDALGYSPLAADRAEAPLLHTSVDFPQGAVTSPALSNLICLRLDRRLAGLCSRRNIVFTRYADDITFSTNNRNALPRLLPSVYRILRDEGFEPNPGENKNPGAENSMSNHWPREELLSSDLWHWQEEENEHARNNAQFPCRWHASSRLPKRGVNRRVASGFLKNVDATSYDLMVRYWEAQKTKYKT